MNAEETNKNLINDLTEKNSQIVEFERTLNNISDVNQIRKNGYLETEMEKMEETIQSLLDDNAELHEQLAHQNTLFDQKKTKYREKIDELEKQTKSKTKQGFSSVSRYSSKKAKDFIKLENELKQANEHIVKLKDYIRKIQGYEQKSFNQSQNRLRLSSRNESKNSINMSKMSYK